MEDLCITCVSCVYGALVYQASQCQGPTVQYKRPSCTAPLHLCISAHCKAQCGGGLASRNRAGLRVRSIAIPTNPLAETCNAKWGCRLRLVLALLTSVYTIGNKCKGIRGRCSSPRGASVFFWAQHCSAHCLIPHQVRRGRNACHKCHKTHLLLSMHQLGASCFVPTLAGAHHCTMGLLR